MKRVFTEADIVANYKSKGSVPSMKKGDILTPSAKDKMKELKMTVVLQQNDEEAFPVPQGDSSFISSKGKVVIGGDHTGFSVKNNLIKVLTEKGFPVQDVGTFNESSCDYPDFAFAVAKKVHSGEAEFGILVDATGIPSAITANKLTGIRAATCYNEFSARSAREHNNANILVLGAKSLGDETMKSILEVWLQTKYGGGRHQKRLDKISEIEKMHL